jgi:cell division transport system permease protein
MRAYFFRQAVQNLNQNRWMNGITFGTISISFLILGIFLLIFLNARFLMADWATRIQITAYLAGAEAPEAASRAEAKVRALEEVRDVTFRSKDAALKSLQERLQGRGLLDGLTRNPLPASLEIRLKSEFQNSAGVRSLTAKLRKMPEIEDLQAGAEWVDRFSAFMAVLNGLGLGLGGLFFLGTIFVIANTIRLNIFARREEIEVMRSVGATGLFIRAPFYIEGILQGFLGACLAMALLFGLFQLFLTKIYEPLRALLNFPLQFLSPEMLAGMIAGGVLLGLLGTQVSIGRYLRV